MDVLADVLQGVRLRSQVYGRMELSAPWGLRFKFDTPQHPSFQLIARGSCWLEVDGLPGTIPLSGGDFVLVPSGRPITLRDRPDTPAVELMEARAAMSTQDDEVARSKILRYGGGGASTSLIGGCFDYEDGMAAPWIGMLPPIIHIKGDGGQPVPWLASTLQFLAAEAASMEPGAEMIRSRLAEIIFIQVIRSHVATEGDQAVGWLQALTDPQVGRALRMIHERPGDPWTVDTLARHALMSRSSFSERFRSLIGVPPLGYVTRWRMHKAAQLLQQGGSTVAVVALSVGYETEGSFGKVFKRVTGQSPGEFRAGAGRRAVSD
jgi:AraC-like DNA-binding protein